MKFAKFRSEMPPPESAQADEMSAAPEDALPEEGMEEPGLPKAGPNPALSKMTDEELLAELERRKLLEGDEEEAAEYA